MNIFIYTFAVILFMHVKLYAKKYESMLKVCLVLFAKNIQNQDRLKITSVEISDICSRKIDKER